MTTAAVSAIEGIHKATALLDSTAITVASRPGITRLGGDEVSLSDTALALIQARIGMAANVSVFHAALKMEKALIDVMG
jgi:hypothetical protein